MKDFKYLKINKDSGIVHVLMDRGDGRNALSYDLMKELTECAYKFKSDIDVNCIILSGQGDSFSVGADLKDETFLKGDETSLERREIHKIGPDMCQAWESLEQITIASIEGHCIGGAIALAVSCDFRVASSSSVFRLPEIPLGMNMSWQANPRINSLIGPARTKELVILGEDLLGEKAFEWGLTQRICKDGEALNLSMELAAKINKLPPIAVRMSKTSINATNNSLNYNSGYMDRDQYLLTGFTEDRKEAIKAFFEKRDANFKGK